MKFPLLRHNTGFPTYLTMNNIICVLEDNEEILNIISLILEDDYEVVGAGTVSEFRALLPTIHPKLFLFDVMLPDGNGLEVCKNMKQDPYTAHIPVMIMTANSQIEKMKEEACADDYIAKPFDIDDLQNRITDLIERRAN